MTKMKNCNNKTYLKREIPYGDHYFLESDNSGEDEQAPEKRLHCVSFCVLRLNKKENL